MSDGQQGGTRDVTYDLISVTYHALQGAETYGLYSVDAEEEGDTELVEFFRQIAEEDRNRAERAREMLGSRMGGRGGKSGKGGKGGKGTND